MKHSYRNPWFSPDKAHYGPEFFTTDISPIEYLGFQIFHRHAGVWELVKDGVCLTQRAGKTALPRLADALLGVESDESLWLVERAQSIADQFGVIFVQREAA